MSEEEIAFREREKYLTEIECSLEVSPEWHFKKRMAAILPQSKAYDLLKAYKSASFQEGVFTLTLDKHLELTCADKEIILAQARSTHEKIDFDDARFGFISSLRIIMPEKAVTSESQGKHELQLPDNIWGIMRGKLIDLIHQGKWVDFHWFSKLEASIDEGSRRLTLKAPSSFVKDWISQNYIHHVEMLAGQIGFAVGMAYGDEKPYYSKPERYQQVCGE